MPTKVEIMEAKFEEAIAIGNIPGVVLLARDRSGKVNYTRSYGASSLRSTRSDTSNPPMQTNALMRIASTTKLFVSILALQLVAAGTLDLDADLDQLLPDLTNQKILSGFDGTGHPLLSDRTAKLTLRHLLTHSSGAAYVMLSEDLQTYMKSQGEPVFKTGSIEERYAYPLIFEPGTQWTYGTGIDWTGRLLERTSHCTLEHLLQQRICTPLGLRDTTFTPSLRPDLLALKAGMSERVNGRFEFTDETTYTAALEADGHFGGDGLWSTPEDVMRVLASLLHDDGKLLDSASRELLFRDALSASSREYLNRQFQAQAALNLGGLLPLKVKKGHALGGLVTLEDCEGNGDGNTEPWRREGDLSWSGQPNVFWHIDRKAGIATLAAYQVQPWSDAACVELSRDFDRAMHSLL